MKDNNYKMLQWSKEVIDQILDESGKYSREDLLLFLQKMSGNFDMILKSEAQNYPIAQSKN